MGIQIVEQPDQIVFFYKFPFFFNTPFGNIIDTVG